MSKIRWALVFLVSSNFFVSECEAQKITAQEVVAILSRTNPETMSELARMAPSVLAVMSRMKRPMSHKVFEFGGRALCGLIALVMFAIANDQCTARASKEYFSEGFHKNNMNNFAPALREWLAQKDSETLWAIAWGILAGGSMGVVAGPALAGLSCIGDVPAVSFKQYGALIAAAIGITAIATGYAYKNADAIANIGLPEDTLARESDREHYMRLFADGRRVDAQAAEDMGSAGREYYYRTAVAHGALYAVGQSAIVGVGVLIVALRIFAYCRYKKEKAIAAEIIKQIVITPENRMAIVALKKAVR